MDHRPKLSRWPAAVVAAVAAGVVIAAAMVPEFLLLREAADLLITLVSVLTGLIVLIAALSFLFYHARRISTGSEALTRHLPIVLGFLLVVGVGLFVPVTDDGGPALPRTLMSDALLTVFEQLYLPLAASLFALPAFFTARTMIAAIEARRPAALWVSGMALAVLCSPLLPWQLWPWAAEMAAWLETSVVSAVMRGLLLSAAVGALIAGVRVLTGQDQPYAEQDR
jgi:hypothetical protein